MTNEKKQNLKPRASEDQEKTGRPTDGIDKQKSLGKKQKKKKTENTMGGRISKLRLNAGMCQDQLAVKLFTNTSRICRLESDNQSPTCSELVLMCELFGTTTDYIVRGIENPPANFDLTPDEKKLVLGLLEKLKNC